MCTDLLNALEHLLLLLPLCNLIYLVLLEAVLFLLPLAPIMADVLLLLPLFHLVFSIQKE